MINSEDSNLEKDLMNDTNDNIINDIVSKSQKFSYLDSEVLSIKKYSKEDLGSFDEVDFDKDFEKIEYSDVDMSFKEQDVVEGTVVAISDKEVLIDIGFKSEGSINMLEFSEKPAIGDNVNVFITSFEDRKGNLILSKEKADFQNRWKELRECFDNNELITGDIIKRIKGGMIVELGVVQAFLPGSQLDIKPVTNFDEFIGKTSEFKIVKFNEFRQNVVVSRKAILADDLNEKRQEVLSTMEVGMVLEGVVKNITDFGAFIDLGGIDGLLHITDITWGRINHPSEKLQVADTVEVKVIDFDVEKVRVSLGMKQLHPEPWEQIQDKYPVNTIISGKVVNMMNYGAFIEIEEGIEGLIHVSEMSWTKHVKHPSDIFQIGDKVDAKILSIDQNDKKISLGVKQLETNPWDEIESKYIIGSKHSGIVKNLTKFGAFVEIEEGIDGLVHVSDLSWTKHVAHPKELLKKNDKVDVIVLEVSKTDHKLSLGIKQLDENPWEDIKSMFSSGDSIEANFIDFVDNKLNVTFEKKVPIYVNTNDIDRNLLNQYCSNLKADDIVNLIIQEVDVKNQQIITYLKNDINELLAKFSNSSKEDVSDSANSDTQS